MHGDGCISVGEGEQLEWSRNNSGKRNENETQLLGPGGKDGQQIKALNSILTWGDNGVEYEAGPRHGELVTQMLGLETQNR